MRQPQSISCSWESCVVRVTPNCEMVPTLAHCQLALKPLRSPPCSAKKMTTLPNQPPVENPSSTGAGATDHVGHICRDASMVSLPTISGKVRAPCRASALPSLVTDRRRALDAQDPELS